ANILRRQGNLLEAEANCREALLRDPRDASAHFNLGAVLVEARFLDQGLAEYHEALRLKPNWAEVHHNVANVLRDLGQTEEARARYQQAMALEPSDALRLKLAILLPVLSSSLDELERERARLEREVATLREEKLSFQDPLAEAGMCIFYSA